MKKIKSWTYTCVTTYNETARNTINDVTITEIIILYLHQYIYKQLALAYAQYETMEVIGKTTSAHMAS